eukprot:scaffold9141_cov70-Phaeocystis_antarctica.AAC.9
MAARLPLFVLKEPFVKEFIEFSGSVWATRGRNLRMNSCACVSMFECANALLSQLSEKDDLDEASNSSEMLPRKAIFPCCINRMVSTAG